MGEDDRENIEPFIIEEEGTRAFKPDTQEYVAVNDARERAREDSIEPSAEERKAFYRRRIQLIESSDIPAERKSRLLAELNESLEFEELDTNAEDDEVPPLPGGVGYGTYYKEEALRFSKHSVLYYRIVTLSSIGSAKNQWLYLTSTNRSPKGVEAYVSYHQEDEPDFRIFDWSKDGASRFALSLPYSKLAKYLVPHSAKGTEYRTIFVANSTRRTGIKTWKNEAMLYNEKAQAYDLIYSNDYELPPEIEHDYHWWGPIVETFEPFPYPTNEIGFFDAQILQDGAAPRLLTDDLTYLKADHAHDPGFVSVLDQPHYSFIVRW